MNIDSRLKKVMPALSARERAILVLESWKEGKQEDPLWRLSMPESQSAEFNRLIALMNGSVLQLGQYITLIEQLVDKLELRQCWLVALVLWEEQLTEIDSSVRLAVKEPITESEYAVKQQEIDEEWVPVRELAELLVDDYDGWAEGDFEKVADWPEPVVSDAAWERVCDEKECLLRRLVATGKLPGRGRGRSLRIQEGVFNRWAGKATTPCPEEALSYRVLPDSEAAVVEVERQALSRVHAAVEARRLTLKEEPEDERVLSRLARTLREGLAESFKENWRNVRAVDLVVAEVAEQFERSDPLRPARREVLDKTRARLLGLAEQLIYLDVKIEMPEPDEELMEIVRRIVFRS